MPKEGKLITVAIHTYEKAVILKTLLEKEGIETVLHNVNLLQPMISSGVRVRIHENDLPLALKIIEQSSLNTPQNNTPSKKSTKNRVLIPVDFSEYSIKACHIGFDFAYKEDAEVILLHSFVGAGFSTSMPFSSMDYAPELGNIEEEKELDKIANKKMRDFVKLINTSIEEGKFPSVKFRHIVAQGVPEDAIIEFGKHEKVSLIVMGTRGKSKKEKELIGSVTAEVLDAGKFPVLTVPEDISLSSIADIKNVVFFSNLHQQDLISFDIFVRMFSDSHLNVVVVPILEKKEKFDPEIQNAILDYCRQHYPNWEFSSKFIGDTDFLKEFSKFVVDDKIDLIVIPNKKRNIFARLFNPSIAHKMLFHADTPMLVIPV